MAKFKPVRAGGKKKAPKARGAIPCIVFLVSLMALLILLFTSILSQSGK